MTDPALGRSGRPVRRIGQVIGVRPERLDEYVAEHRAVWPGVLEQLQASGICNYSIFHHDGLLFAYFEYVGDDFDQDMEAMAADPETQRWWDLVGPMQRRLDDTPEGDWWHDLVEVFHFDGDTNTPPRSAPGDDEGAEP